MKHRPQFDFRKQWSTLSDEPYPKKKLCRHVLKEISTARQEYQNLFDKLAHFVVVDNLLEKSEEDIANIEYVEAEISYLLETASILWDSYQVAPFPLRHRRKLDKLIKRLEEDFKAITFGLYRIRNDIQMLNTLVIGDWVTPLSDIQLPPEPIAEYYMGQNN